MSLSPRQTEVCSCLVKGRSDKEIANDLGISIWSVRTHMKILMVKFKAKSRTTIAIGFSGLALQTTVKKAA